MCFTGTVDGADATSVARRVTTILDDRPHSGESDTESPAECRGHVGAL